MDKAVGIHPLVALGHNGPDWSAFGCPHPPEDGFEADAMLVHGPQLDSDIRIQVLNASQFLWQSFF